MLRRKSFARLAQEHSPEKEQRLLSFAKNTPSPDQNEDEGDGPINGPSKFPAGQGNHEILTRRQQFHDAIFEATSKEDRQQVIDEYLPDILSLTGGTEKDVQDSNTTDIIEMTRMAMIDKLSLEEKKRNTLIEALSTIDTLRASEEAMQLVLDGHRGFIAHYFTMHPSIDRAGSINILQALLHKDIERIRKMKFQREKGVQFDCMYEDDFEKKYRAIRNIPSREKVRIPSAFSDKRTMYFNIEHAHFRDPQNRERFAKRAVTHEATHLALLHPVQEKFGLQPWTNTLRSHPEWPQLKAAVLDVFRNDPDYLDEKNENSNKKIVEEALAIFMTESRHPRDEAAQGKQRRVHDIFASMLEHPHTGHLHALRESLDTKVDFFLEQSTRDGSQKASPPLYELLLTAAKDNENRENLEKRIGVRRKADDARTNPDEEEGNQLFNTEVKQLKGADDKSKIKPEDILTSVGLVESKLQEMRDMSPKMEQSIREAPIDAAQKEELIASALAQREFLGEMGTDLVTIRRYADAFTRWEKPLSEGGPGREEKSEIAAALHMTNLYANADTTMEQADEACKANRQQALEIMKTVLEGYEKIHEKMSKAIEVGRDANAVSGVPETGVFGWLKKTLFTNSGGILWMTPLNIIHIVKAYKDAIVENYKSVQLVKENAVAKAIAEKVFLFKPIEHTLKKQARSTNSKESSEFHEYIEKEGYTFEEVFGKNGKGNTAGLLFQNLHNFNRAKAVLEYAADRAWLYHLDRLNGHNVYGLDFEKIEGHQSFEELVQKHEAGKAKQIQHGSERVDKDPDVVPIMATLLHELEHKNIFAVQGIMQRLQDKAKFSHSNTWMLTTLLMYIRDNCEGDPTLKLCLDKGMIDNISNHTIGQSAWSITWLKILRNPIEAWKNNGEKSGKEGFGNNILTKTMEKIEKRLEQCGAKFPANKEGNMAKYEAIAMILSGKTFPTNITTPGAGDEGRGELLQHGWNEGSTISIFDNEFNEYRQAYLATANSTTDPSKTDDDYFNPKNEGSDMLLAGRVITEAIIIKQSQGTFTYPSKAVGYFAQLIDRDEELGMNNPQAQQNFRKEMRAKLTPNFKSNYQNAQAAGQIKNDRDAEGRLILKELIERKIICEEDFASNKQQWETLTTNMARQ